MTRWMKRRIQRSRARCERAKSYKKLERASKHAELSNKVDTAHTQAELEAAS